MGLFNSTRTTIRAVYAIPALLIYPLSILFVYLGRSPRPSNLCLLGLLGCCLLFQDCPRPCTPQAEQPWTQLLNCCWLLKFRVQCLTCYPKQANLPADAAPGLMAASLQQRYRCL